MVHEYITKVIIARYHMSRIKHCKVQETIDLKRHDHKVPHVKIHKDVKDKGGSGCQGSQGDRCQMSCKDRCQGQGRVHAMCK